MPVQKSASKQPAELAESNAPGAVLIRRLRAEADIDQYTIPVDTVENDPLQTSGFELCRYAQWPLNPNRG
jgi:hypothetical protein